MRLFLAYSEKDREHVAWLHRQLERLKQEQIVSGWVDRRLPAGGADQEPVSLSGCGLMLALMSSDFLATGYCESSEMRDAIARHELGKLTIVPIILEPCDWKRSPLGRLRALPQGGLPIEDWKSPEAAFRDIGVMLRTMALDEGAVRPWDPSDTVVQDSEGPLASLLNGDAAVLDARCEAAFRTIREFFRRSTAEYRAMSGVAVRFRDLGPRRFACLAHHPLRNRNEATITIHAAEAHGESAIAYSLIDSGAATAARGWMHVQSRGKGVLLDAEGLSQASQPVSETAAAQRLWLEFLHRAGIPPSG